MKNKILIAAALLVSVNLVESCNNSTGNMSKNEMDGSMTHKSREDSMSSGKMQKDNGLMQSMSSTMDKMHDMKMTGDFDLDFANMMVMHHQAAVDMSKVEIAKGTDARIKTMAQNIITAQKAEIEQMQQFIKNHKMQEAKQNAEMHHELDAVMKDMMDKMKSIQMTGNADKDFVMMMIPHHESAVEMAEDELSHGKHQELKKMARVMIADQNKEIADFEAWLASQK